VQTYGRVAPRSGLAAKKGIDVGAGVIDADFRGELKVVLFNHSTEDFKGVVCTLIYNTLILCMKIKDFSCAVNCGDKIAQLIVERIEQPNVMHVAQLDETQRSTNGFGSTGNHNRL